MVLQDGDLYHSPDRPRAAPLSGTDLWIATENLSQVGGNLTKLSGKTGNQILVVPQSPLPVGLDIDGSGNPIVILTVGGSNAYQYIVRSFARDGTLNEGFLCSLDLSSSRG